MPVTLVQRDANVNTLTLTYNNIRASGSITERLCDRISAPSHFPTVRGLGEAPTTGGMAPDNVKVIRR